MFSCAKAVPLVPRSESQPRRRCSSRQSGGGGGNAPGGGDFHVVALLQPADASGRASVRTATRITAAACSEICEREERGRLLLLLRMRRLAPLGSASSARLLRRNRSVAMLLPPSSPPPGRLRAAALRPARPSSGGAARRPDAAASGPGSGHGRRGHGVHLHIRGGARKNPDKVPCEALHFVAANLLEVTARRRARASPTCCSRICGDRESCRR